MNITIRQIALNDVAGFHAAFSSVACEKKYLLRVEPPALDGMHEFVKQNVENEYAQYVALVNDSVIGWAGIIPIPRKSMEHVGTLGMGVISEYRGKGIGGRLLEKSIQHAWRQGLKRLELEVFSDNEFAIQLYEKQGFHVEGVKRYARCLDGVYQDVVVMAQYQVE